MNACTCATRRETELRGERVLLRERGGDPTICTWGACSAPATKLHLCHFGDWVRMTLADRYCDECSEMDVDCARSGTRYELEVVPLAEVPT